MKGISLRADFERLEGERGGADIEGRGADAASVGAGGDLRRGARSEAARIGGVTLQIVRDWVVRFNAEGPEGLIDKKAPGQPPLLNEDATRRARGGRGKRPDPGDSWRRALADY